MSAILLRGARLVGGADAPTDLLLAEGRVRAVGVSRHDLFELGRGPAGAIETVDLDGRWVHPGLWDQHVHLTQWALTGGRLDVSAAASAAEAAAIVREHVATEAPAPGEVLVGTGFRDGLWPDAPSAEGLDVGDVPVCLISHDVHSIWSNRAATLLLGLGEDGWMLREQAAFDLNVRLGALPDAALDRAVLAAARRAAARGVVGVVDLELEGAPAAWARRFAAGFRGLRVRAGVYPAGLEAAVAAGIRSGVAVEGTDGLLEGGPFKLFTDGALGTRTAWCDEPYPGPLGAPTRGHLAHEPAELLAAAREALGHGLVPTIHAIGDAAVALALDAFAALGPAPTGARWRMEHAQLVRDADLPRFAELGVTAGVQPRHAIDDRDLADEFWADRTGRMYPFRALLDAGAELALGSDAPVAPLDPWAAIAAAVTRTADGRPSWHPEQQITTAEALAASTDGLAGLREGGPADLVVLDVDPLAIRVDDPPAAAVALAAVPVHATMVAGRWTHGPYGG
ncbi:MAG: amidohydrolase family protein [Actinomycetales bacterium]|nr:amidohydrolase family protein [Actinomycetales bacterium]